jgi:excisionase family DNA binding protein
MSARGGTLSAAVRRVEERRAESTIRPPSDRLSSASDLDTRATHRARVLRLSLAEDHEPWVTKTQLAEHLKVHEKTVERLVAKGMPCLRPGRRAIRFRISECEAWVGAQS